MVDKPLDRAAIALHMSIPRADVTIAALRAAFETDGKTYSYDKTANIVVEAIKHPDKDDPDVRYAAEWLRSQKPAG